MTVKGANRIITQAALSWPGVSAHPHRFGGTEYRLGERREIGHTHGDYLVDIPFPVRVRDELIAVGRAEPHHIFPKSGNISFYLRESGDAERASELLRLSYELAVAQKSRHKPAAASSGDDDSPPHPAD